MITYETVKNELAGIVNSDPNKVYQRSANGCMYFHGNEPGCLVGHWLAMHGVTAKMVNDLDINAGHSAEYAIRKIGMDVTDAAVTLLCDAQELQDSKMPWGAALTYAVDKIENED